MDQVDSINRLLTEKRIEAVVAGPVDVDGQWHVKRYPADAFARRRTYSQPSGLFLADVTDDFYMPAIAETWQEGLPDTKLTIDAGSMYLFPGRAAVACFIADYTTWHGDGLAISPRAILRGVEQQLAAAGLEAQVAVELEFHVLKEDARTLRDSGFGDPTRAGWGYQPFALTHAVPQLDGWIEKLIDAGLPVTAYNAEYGSGHFEVNLQHTSPVQAADQAILLKRFLRDLAAGDGLTVSFMARIATDSSASSGHIHTSMWRDGSNIFWDAQRNSLSPDLKHFLAGAVTSLPGFAAINGPFVNSYKRLLEHSGSPTTATWGLDNRTVALRVIAHDPDAVRVENRVPGADANPYLTIAATLASGLWGMEHELDPPEAVVGNVWETQAHPPLPLNLKDAVEELEKSDLAKEVFGEGFVASFAESRRRELDVARRSVADWERARYLERV